MNSNTFKLEELKAADLTSYLQQEQQELQQQQEEHQPPADEQFTITEVDDEDESLDNALDRSVNRKLNFFV